MDIETYDPNAKGKELKKFFSACVYGMRRSGKGVFTHHLVKTIQKKHKFTKAVLFSRSAKLQEDDFQFVPEKNKYDYFSDDKLNEIIEEHKKEVTKWKETKEGEQPNLLVIVDDLISPSGSKGETIFYSKALADLYILGRHIFCSVISLLQSIKLSVPPLARKNCDLIIYFRANSKTDVETLVNDYLLLPEKTSKDAKRLINEITKVEYTSLAVNNNLAQYASDYKDFVFRVECKPVKINFVIGDDDKEVKPFKKVESDDFTGLRIKKIEQGVML